jgi:hypothetical protein
MWIIVIGESSVNEMPPAYDIAAKLPTYEEAEMTKHSDSRVSQMFSTFYTSIHTNKIKSQPLVPCTYTLPDYFPYQILYSNTIQDLVFVTQYQN